MKLTKQELKEVIECIEFCRDNDKIHPDKREFVDKILIKLKGC